MKNGIEQKFLVDRGVTSVNVTVARDSTEQSKCKARHAHDVSHHVHARSQLSSGCIGRGAESQSGKLEYKRDRQCNNNPQYMCRCL